MKKLLLSFIMLLAAVSMNAQTFDDLLGYYSQTWYSHAHDDASLGWDSSNRDLWNVTKLPVRVESAGDNKLSFTNLFGYPASVEGVVDMDAMSITFTEQGLAKGEDAFLGSKVTTEDGDKYEKTFVARITDEGNIVFYGLAIIYNPETPEEGGEEEGTRAEGDESEGEVEEMELELTWTKGLDDNGNDDELVEYMVEKQYIKWAFTLDDGTVVNSGNEAIEDLLYTNDRTKDYNYRFKVKDGFNKIKAVVNDEGHFTIKNDEGNVMNESFFVTEFGSSSEYGYDKMIFRQGDGGEGEDNNETDGVITIKGTWAWIMTDWITVEEKGNLTLTVSWHVDEDEDGIVNASSADTDAPVYNLLGQRVGKNAKGLLIINGKKLFVK